VAAAAAAAALPPPLPPSCRRHCRRFVFIVVGVGPTPRCLWPRPPPRATGIPGVAVEDAGPIHDVAIVAVAIDIVAVAVAVAVAIAIVAVVAVARDVAPPSFATFFGRTGSSSSIVAVVHDDDARHR
jgi:hypothetical protein